MSKLYIVGTPIGNLKDITLRALETLKMVDYIACEDTRVSYKLLQHYNIEKSLLIYNKINEKKSTQNILKILDKGKNVALITDAGMPLLSDPGLVLLNEVKNTNHEIEIIPGVNAAITAFALSGLDDIFCFHGFPEETSGKRYKQLENLDINFAHIFYVSPYKIEVFLKDLNNIYSNEINIFVSKELTKIHEKYFWASPNEALEILKNSTLKGEFTLVLKFKEKPRIKINKYQEFSKIK